MGMTYEQYWVESPYLVIAFRKAYRLRREVENENAWLHGLYVYNAVAVCLSNALSKRGSKKQEYIDRPIDIFPLTEKEKKRREMEERQRVMKTLETMQQQQRQRKTQKGD